MQPRWIAALVVPAFVAGLVCTFPALASKIATHPVTEILAMFASWIMFALIFEVVVLLPMIARLRNQRYFKYKLPIAGTVAWYLVIALGWYFLFLGVPFVESLVLSLPMAIPGFAVSATFTLLWARIEHA